MIPRACALVLPVLSTTISIASAADQTITLRLGAGSTIMLERPYKIVLIGDPRVLKIRRLDDRSVAIEPLDLGATNLIFMDESGIAIVNISVLVCAATTRAMHQDG